MSTAAPLSRAHGATGGLVAASQPRTRPRTESVSTQDRLGDGGLLVDMANGRWEQKFLGDDFHLYLANEAGVGVRALAKQYGISKSVVAARIARVRKRLTADPWTKEPRRRRRNQPGSETPSADSPAPAREEVVPALQRAYTYSDWLDDRDFAAGWITAEQLGRRRAPRQIRFVRL